MSLTGIELNAHRHQDTIEDSYTIIYFEKENIYSVVKSTTNEKYNFLTKEMAEICKRILSKYSDKNAITFTCGYGDFGESMSSGYIRSVFKSSYNGKPLIELNNCGIKNIYFMNIIKEILFIKGFFSFIDKLWYGNKGKPH